MGQDLNPVTAAELVFWDFDGVVKESVDIKTRAFVDLFRPYGEEVARRVEAHHLQNGGMSRFEKIPLYVKWAGLDGTRELIDQLCARFAAIVEDAVVSSDWVPGVERLLRQSGNRSIFVLATATPQAEIESILHRLSLERRFARVFGAPTSKKDALAQGLRQFNVDPGSALMIGDATADLEAARANNVPFLLRRHGTNEKIFEHYTGTSIKDFTHL